MGFGIIIIGSELTTGKRQDGHMAHAIEALYQRGLELAWCTLVADAPARIIDMLRHSMAGTDVVFSFGGIGATPDDHTRASAAQAAGVVLARHPQAAAIIEQRFGQSAYPQRIRMADLPAGCTLIPNPVNRIPGFSIRDHHFLPGFPQMAWPMLEWVLDRYYAHFFKAEPVVESRFRVFDASEGLLIDIMEHCVACFPRLQFSSLPHMEDDYRETELGVRGTKHEVETATKWLRTQLAQSGFRWQRV